MPSAVRVPVSVHRCRFVDYTPSPVTALAVPPVPPPPAARPRQSVPSALLRPSTLAVGHANGNIDLYTWASAPSENDSAQSWVLFKTLPGHISVKIDNLLFTLKDCAAPNPHAHSNLRLFSTGGGSELLEWDITIGSVFRTVSSQGGVIWSLAANPASDRIALGCDDGAVRILSLDDNSLEHHRRFDRTKARLLSIAWGPASRYPSKPINEDHSEDDEDSWRDSWLVAGCSDSCLRKFDLGSGRVLERMSVDKAKDQRTLVWSVGCLSDGTIVSGDSLGTVKFWSSKTYTQLASFPAHGADVLALAIGPNDDTVYSTGVDQKVSQFAFVNTGPRAVGGPGRWVHACSRRMHSHDVRALVTWPPHQPLTPPASSLASKIGNSVSSFVISGGLDMAVCVCPCIPPAVSGRVKNLNGPGDPGSFEEAYYRRMPYGLATNSVLQVSPASRSLLCRNDDKLTLYRLSDLPTTWHPENHQFEDGNGWVRVAEIQLQSMTNLTSSAVSNDGEWICASDYYEAKLFHLNYGSGKQKCSVQRIKSFGDCILSQVSGETNSAGASAMVFTPDSHRLVLSMYGSPCTLIIEIPPSVDLKTHQPQVIRSFEHKFIPSFGPTGPQTTIGEPHEGGNGDDDDVYMAEAVEQYPPKMASRAWVMNFAVSRDAQWLAVADSYRRVELFNLDTLQHHCTLPSFPLGISSLAFDPAAPAMLYIGFKNNTIQIFDVEGKLFPDWSRSVCASLPKRFTQLHDSLQGLMFDPHGETGSSRGSTSIYAWGSSWLCRLDLNLDASEPEPSRRKRVREDNKPVDEREAGKSDAQHFEVCTRYRNILHVAFLGPKELVIVERPITDVLQTLPPAYFKPKYGTA